MKDRLLQFLSMRNEEESLISLLLAQSVLLGIFYGAFDIGAHSLFLSVFDEKDLARAYAISGFIGIILTGLFYWFKGRISLRNLAVFSLFSVTVLSLILWATLNILSSKLVIFIIFVMFGPLNIIAFLGFRISAQQFLYIHNIKRLPGLVYSAIIIGIIVISFVIPLLLILQFRSHNLLLISTISLLVASTIQIISGRKLVYPATKPVADKKIPGLSGFSKDPFIRIIGVFIALSVMVVFFIQYSFMAVTREQYPVEEEMAQFLGLFTGVMMILALLSERVLFSFIIKSFGLRLCLLFSPVILAGLTVITIILGLSFGYTPAASGGFILFLLILALSRMFSRILKDSVVSSSLKIISNPIDEKWRYKLLTGVDGSYNEIAVILTGLLLVFLGALPFIKLIHFSLILLVITAVWILVAGKLFLQFRKSVRNSFQTQTTQETGSVSALRWGTLKNRISGRTLLKSSFFKLVTGDLSVIENTENRWFFRELIDYTEIKQDLNMLASLKKIAAKPDMDENLRHRSAEVIDQLEETKGDPRKLKKSFTSPVEDEKLINARKTLASQRLPQTTEILRLLRSNNLESRRYAIYMIGKFGLKDMIPEVCNCLGHPGLEKDALSILDSFGAEDAKELFRLYLGSSGSIRISKLIIRLLSNSDTKENTDFLFARLWSNSRQVKEAAVKSLIGFKYSASTEERAKLNQLICEIIDLITWNILAQSCLNSNNNPVLSGIIKKETSSWMNFLFDILSIAYNPGSISLIRANTENGTIETVSYALQIVDILIDDPVRSKLIELVNRISDDEKLKNLHKLYPDVTVSYDQLIEDILNRDYNLISIWAKAFTLNNIRDISRKSTEESVIALLFSPERILQEEAARLIARTKREIFSSVSARLPKDSLEIPGKIFSGDIDDKEFLISKVRFLSSVFKVIPEDELLFLAGSLKYIKNITEIPADLNPHYILWNSNSDFSQTRVYTITGEDPSEYKGYILSDNAFFYLLPLDILEDFQTINPEQSFEIYNYLNDYEIKTSES